MILLERFLTEIRAIRAAQPTYRLGGSGVDGTCDCIGLIIGALRRAGGTWSGTHGSNYAARSEMAGLRRVTSAADMEVGGAVYKARGPGDSGYDLPSKYHDRGDLLDYYHVGVVMSVSPVEIWHCTGGSGGGGIRGDTKLGDPQQPGSWRFAGRLQKINYGEGWAMQEEGSRKALVVAAGGSTVHLRKLPDKAGDRLVKVPVGTWVDVLEAGSQWCTVMALGKRGYMMREFLDLQKAVPQAGETGQAGEAETPREEGAAVLARLAALEARMDALEAGVANVC